MSNVDTGPLRSFGQIAADCVPRYVSHSIGGSMFFLAYAISHAGVITFTIILAIEAYFTGCSLLYIQELAKYQSRRDGEQTNYFIAIERNYSKRIRQFIRVLFIIDVVNCTAFYYKVSQTLLEALVFDDNATPRERTGTTIVTCSIVTLLLIGMEYGQKYLLNLPRMTQQISTCNMRGIQAEVVQVAFAAQPENECEEDKINMTAVKNEMNNFSRKRPVLLLLFMLLFFATVAVSYDTPLSDEINVFNVSMQCPGLQNSISWIKLDMQVFSVIAICLFALKNYSIMLPVCVEELSYSREEFTRLVFWSEFALVLIYSILPLPIYLTFGESVPALYLTGYGRNMVGFPMVCLALAMTVNAMLLRIMACFKLMQVLFIKDDTENVFWLVVIFSVFASLLLALVVSHVLYLVVFAGCVTCNLLIIIFPCISYIKLRWYEDGLNMNIVLALCSLYIHLGLLIISPYALYTLDPHIGKGCRSIMNYYWKSRDSISPTCSLAI